MRPPTWVVAFVAVLLAVAGCGPVTGAGRLSDGTSCVDFDWTVSAVPTAPTVVPVSVRPCPSSTTVPPTVTTGPTTTTVTATTTTTVSTTVPTTTQPPTSVWPNAANTGPRVAPTRTTLGANIDSTAWFRTYGYPGVGTVTDPFVVSRVKFTGAVTLGGWDLTDLRGKVVKFVDCYFHGNPKNPTEGGSGYLWVRDTGPRVVVEDSLLGPSATPLLSGGPPSTVGGTDKGLFAYVPFELRRSEVWGANVLVGFETSRGEGPSVIEDNWLHDIWSSSGDHTDIVNGNAHASHVTVRHNYMDGIRTGGSYVTNGFGIYDDPVSSSAGIIEDWHLVGNYVDRSASTVMCSTSTSRFRDPFVVRDNVFARHSLQRWACRTPSAQSGNVDTQGTSIRF